MAAPTVVTDISPTHSLVSQVMEGVGQPHLVVPLGASPHHYIIRPSNAHVLAKADLVFWISRELTPWINNSLVKLNENVRSVELLSTPGTTVLSYRDTAIFEDYVDGHNHEEHSDHEKHEEHSDHEEHEEHSDHEEHEEHEEHSDHEEHEEHSDHRPDPHAWLDPENGKLWLDIIASELSKIDPINSASYRANAENGKSKIDTEIAKVEATLSQLRGGQFLVFHDAYQYFEDYFGISAIGSIMVSDAVDPSPARILELNNIAKKTGLICVFSEPQFNPGLIRSVIGDATVKSHVIDPLGTQLELGKNFYPQLIRSIAQTLASCL